MDNRKNYYLTIDTETANTLDDPIVYNIGGAIHDKQGRVEETFSFVIREVFYGCIDLMQTAYYADKIPSYIEGIAKGEYEVVSYTQAKFYIRDLCKKYGVKAIIAHNARFDYIALNTTERLLTSSKYRYFLPYGIPIWDTLAMARTSVAKQKSYIKWCRNHDAMRSKNTPRMTAEVLYRYISGDTEFSEAHTALADVLIEKEIFAWCNRQHKAMQRSPWKK